MWIAAPAGPSGWGLRVRRTEGSADRGDIVVGIAVDVEIIGIDAGMGRPPGGDEAQDLAAAADRPALHRNHVRAIEGAAAGKGGEQADLDRFGKRRLALL